MKNNKNRLSYQAQLSRHSHDLSSGYTASMTTGQIIPQYFHILSPGDKIYSDMRLFCRLQNVVTAFLGEIDVHVDTFFVPLQMMYTPFGQMFAQTNDYLTSFINEQILDNKDGWPLYNIDEVWNSFDPRDRLLGHTECVGKETARLFDALDLNPMAVLNDIVKQTVGFSGQGLPDAFCHNPKISPWIFAAYQAIYQKYYRNDEFEKLSVSDYNFDKFYNQTAFSNDKMRFLRYIQRPSDYFTDTRVSPMYSAVNASWTSDSQDESFGGVPSGVNSNLNKILSYLDSYGNSLFGSKPETPVSSASLQGFDYSGTTLQQPSQQNFDFFNTSNIRALFAVDKFARIYGRADKTYDAQMLAHFGVDIPHDVKHDLTHISHYHSVLQSDPIYGTANAVSSEDNQISAIGQVGGQGQCVLTGKCDFVAPVHGVFMAVAYIVTKPRYFGTFSKLHLVTDRLHLPIPEFDKLGAQPLYYFEFNPSNLDYQTNPSHLSARAGWQNRYSEFKKKYNRVSISYYGGAYDITIPNNNIYAPWVVSRLPFASDLVVGPTESSFVSVEQFFERADALNSVMVNEFAPNWSNDYFRVPHMMFQSDPILTEFYNNCKLVSWMSETGDPDL